MKFIVLLFSFNLLSQTVEFDLGDPDSGSFKNYKLESCENLRADLNKCSDESISYTQPASTGINGYEGKCGQTAAANISTMICEEFFGPKEIDNLFKDLTPGVHPRTLLKGLNQLIKKSAKCSTRKTFKLTYPKTEDQYILNLSMSESPVAVLIRNPGGQVLHWITIVETIYTNHKCDFIINHWGGQYSVPCHVIARWSRGVKDSYGAILKKYTIIK